MSWLASTDGRQFYGCMVSGDTGGWVGETFDLGDVDSTDQGALVDEVVIRKQTGGAGVSERRP